MIFPDISTSGVLGKNLPLKYKSMQKKKDDHCIVVTKLPNSSIIKYIGKISVKCNTIKVPIEMKKAGTALSVYSGSVPFL